MTYKIKIKDIKKEDIPYIKNLCEESNCEFSQEWKSKHDSQVVYDYEPFCSEGFEINLKISSHNSAYLDFIKYLYDEKLHTLEYLKNLKNKLHI